PRSHFYPCPGGAAPLARSTPTLPTRAQRDVGKDTPQKTYFLIFTLIIGMWATASSHKIFVFCCIKPKSS
ncbi:MAG: hypothetical protein RML94_07610, partial [Bacteroidia bacterium]|nr:hypothetical protein [Bacteroidia bacterium]